MTKKTTEKKQVVKAQNEISSDGDSLKKIFDIALLKAKKITEKYDLKQAGVETKVAKK